MTAESNAWRFPTAQSGRFGTERRGARDRRQARDRREQNPTAVVVERRIGFDRRTLRERRSASDQRRQGHPIWSPGTAR